MAYNGWMGTTSGDFNTASNWVNNLTLGVGAVPVAAENWSVRPNALQGITTGLNQATKKFGIVLTERGSSVSIGAPGNALICGAVAIKHLGSGSFYHDDPADVTTVVDTDLIIVNSDNLTSAYVYQQQSIADAAQVLPRFVVAKGKVTIGPNLNQSDNTAVGITLLEIHSRTNLFTDAVVEVLTGQTSIANASVVGTIQMHGGSLMCEAKITNLYMGAGAVTKNKFGITNLWMFGGTCYYNAPENFGATGGGILTQANVFGSGALLDLRQTSDQKLITTARRYSGGQILRNEMIHLITNDHDTLGFGAQAAGGGEIG